MNQTYEKIWATALRKIEIRLHSKKELMDKLELDFPHDRGLILKALEEMERLHLLNDHLFAEQFLAHLTQKNFGRLKIFHATRLKGLPNDLVEQVLLDIEWSEEEAIKRAIEEKSRLLAGVDERKKKQKLVNFLKNRGFGDQVIMRGLRMMD